MDAQKELQIKINARRVYLWLLFSPLLTLPCLGLNALTVSYRASFLEKAGGLAWPLIFHVILIPWLLSPDLFIKRHAQQGLILVALRYLSALLFLGAGTNLGWFVMVNGGLVVLGSIWGMNQVERGANSLMVFQGEMDQLPGDRSIAVLKKAAASKKRPSAPRPAVSQPLHGPAQKLRLGRQALIKEMPDKAAGYFAEAFRDGDRQTRQEALSILEMMGEVEVF